MLSNGMIIRKASLEDVAATKAMQERSLRQLGAGFYPPEAVEAFLDFASTMDEAVVREGHYFITQTVGGRIVASAGWSQLLPGYAPLEADARQAGDARRATVRSVFVDPELPRLGLGTAIMQVVEHDALKAGIEIFELKATLSGVPFYRALDYSEASAGHFDLGSVTFPYLNMHKTLVRRQVGLRA